jgi:hypothetical protein
MAQGDVHVVPSKAESKWVVEVDGSSRSTHETQAQAREAGRELARSNNAELHVHGRNGQVRDRNSYGNDPRRSKG